MGAEPLLATPFGNNLIMPYLRLIRGRRDADHRHGGAGGHRLPVGGGRLVPAAGRGRGALRSSPTDLYYIQNWSLALDFKILWMTIMHALRHNAY